MKLTISFFAVAASVFGYAETVTELNLTADCTINVPAGTTTDVARVSGGAYTITKTGGGMLRFGWVKNGDAKLIVQEGAVDFFIPQKPACIAEKAFLHVDANVLDSAYVTAENGTNFVTRWTDASGGSHYAKVDQTTAGKWRTAETIGTPYVLEDYQNGLNVLDFGHYQQANITNADGVASVKGAAMNFDAICRPVRDVFAVIGYREEIKTVYDDYGCADASALLSYTESWCFLPGKLGSGYNPPLFNYWQNAVSQSLLGEVYYDDYHIKGSAIGSAANSAGAKAVPDGLFYLNVRPAEISELPEGIDHKSDNTGLNAFARDRGNNFGGQRIGEYIVFNERLSEAERFAVENYLRTKWFAMEQKFSRVEVAAGASFGNGAADRTFVGQLGTGADLMVAKGVVEVDALRETGAWLHLDAAKSSTMLISEEEGRTYVTNWFDADSGSRYAYHYAKVNTWRADPENRRPFITSGIASNSLPVVDFGYPQNQNITNSAGEGVGYGAAMRFSTSCATVRETIVVAGDREEAPFITDTYPSPGNSASFIGGRATGYVHFFRTAYEKGLNPIVISRFHNQTRPIFSYANGIALDGVVKTYEIVEIKDGPSVRLPDNGMHVVNFRMRQDGYVSGLAHDENYAYGGVRIGEVLVFESELPDDVRNRIVKTLMTKWMDKPPYVYGCGNLAVVAGAELKLPYAAVSAESLKLGGKVTAEKVFASTIEPVSASAAVDGVLDMSTAGEVVLGDAVYPAARAGDTIRIIAAGAVAGDVSGWTVSGSLAEKFIVKLSAGDDGLYADLYNRGFSIIVR